MYPNSDGFLNISLLDHEIGMTKCDDKMVTVGIIATLPAPQACA